MIQSPKYSEGRILFKNILFLDPQRTKDKGKNFSNIAEKIKQGGKKVHGNKSHVEYEVGWKSTEMEKDGCSGLAACANFSQLC